MYDFIIFEHSGLRNHFVDLCKIGRILMDCNYRVAIANVTAEAEYCRNCGIDILTLKAFRDNYECKDSYMKAVFEELIPRAKYFYAGSILSDTDLSWLRYAPSSHKIFLWALRSFFFTNHRRLFMSRTYFQSAIRSYRNLRTIRRLQNVCFFVSEPIIRDEIVSLGIEPYRIVHRPERTCNNFSIESKDSTKVLNLLSMGTLRPEKRVDLCIKAINQLADENIQYTIAGKAYTTHGYDQKIDRMSSQSRYTTRVSRRLDDDEYNKLIKGCDYFVLCDEKQPSCVTNGTMAEALLAGKPIIAPNYDPYKFYIEKYHVGLLYKMHNIASLRAAIMKAKVTEYSEFADGLRRYQMDLMYDVVLRQFAQDISETLNFNSYV